MADVPARTELKVTTGAIRGSRKIYVEGRGNRRARRHARGRSRALVRRTTGCALRHERALHRPGSPDRHPWLTWRNSEARWIRGRGDVEEVAQRAVQPEDNGQLGPDRSGGVQPFPSVRKKVLRARAGRQCHPNALRQALAAAAGSSEPQPRPAGHSEQAATAGLNRPQPCGLQRPRGRSGNLTASGHSGGRQPGHGSGGIVAEMEYVAIREISAVGRRSPVRRRKLRCRIAGLHHS